MTTPAHPEKGWEKNGKNLIKTLFFFFFFPLQYKILVLCSLKFDEQKFLMLFVHQEPVSELEPEPEPTENSPTQQHCLQVSEENIKY